MEEFWQGVLRLGVALLLGGMIGFDREMLRKSAGLRTMMIVSMGAALFALTGERVIGDDPEISKVLAGIAGGVGFIGAGAIIQSRGEVRGLTTAASIWLTAAVGVACGFGEFALACAATVMGVVVLSVLVWIEQPIVDAGEEVREKRDSDDAKD